MLSLSQQIICLISCCMLISTCESVHHERHIIHVPVFVHFVHHHHKIIQKRPRKGRFRGHAPHPHSHPYSPYKSPYRYRQYSHSYSQHGHPVPPGAFRSLPVKHIRVPVHHVAHVPVPVPVRVPVPVPLKPVKSVPRGKGFRHNHVHVYHAHPG